MLNAKVLLVTMLLLVAVSVRAESPPLSSFVVHFETGPGWDNAKPPAEQNGFREHSANLNRLRQSGVITFGARYEDYGMIFIKAASLDAATSIVASDPGVESEIFVYRIAPLSVFYPWKE